jgi:hypothetical protein
MVAPTKTAGEMRLDIRREKLEREIAAFKASMPRDDFAPDTRSYPIRKRTHTFTTTDRDGQTVTVTIHERCPIPTRKVG